MRKGYDLRCALLSTAQRKIYSMSLILSAHDDLLAKSTVDHRSAEVSFLANYFRIFKSLTDLARCSSKLL